MRNIWSIQLRSTLGSIAQHTCNRVRVKVRIRARVSFRVRVRVRLAKLAKMRSAFSIWLDAQRFWSNARIDQMHLT